ncbi:MAG TPA: DNA polymerase III subunit delta [Saprospiraceae bacterium]|nr:DNA polymerase III subunit delta [Saprospiraceae bacterium]HQW54639.1 DNA polymerase III subunit delta [Saprospiraceae bacterium]
MAEYSFEQVSNQIATRQLANVYLLHGNEPFFIDQLTDLFIDKVLPAESRDFNLNILYGAETNINSVLDCLSQFPMGSDYQLVVVKNAQSLKNINQLAAYADNPFPSAILVLAHHDKNLDGKLKLTKAIKSKHAVYESKTLWENQLPGWIKQQVKLSGKSIADYNAELLAEYLGNDLKKISNEVEKLLIVTLNDKEITGRHIEQFIGISRNFNVFELNAAFAFKNAKKAYMVADYLADNMKEGQVPMIVSAVFGYFQKIFLLRGIISPTDQQIISIINSRSTTALKEYRAALANYLESDITYILALLKTYDQYSKGVNVTAMTNRDLLLELVFKVLHSREANVYKQLINY